MYPNNLTKILNTTLLKPEEEISHAKAIKDYIDYKESLEGKTEITKEEENKLNRLKNKFKRSKDILITHNTRLVLSEAKKYIDKGVELEDLVQEGILGLNTAAIKFNPEKGCRFSTYATYWIRQAISRAIGNKSRTIRVPVHLDTKARRIPAIKKENPHITNQQIADLLGISLSICESLQGVGNHTTSLDKEITVGGTSNYNNTPLAYLVKDENTTHPEEQLDYSMLKADIDYVLSLLDPIEAEIIRLRYGINEVNPWTLNMIADKVGLSRERVRQIESKVKTKLRTPTFYTRLIGYDY
jgi:RNA polymerase sigma factor (sigma-70 family)